MLTDKHKEVEAFLSKHKHRRYTADQVHQHIESLVSIAQARNVCNQLVELGLIREHCTGYTFAYQAWPNASAVVPEDVASVNPKAQANQSVKKDKNQAAITKLPTIELKEELPVRVENPVKYDIPPDEKVQTPAEHAAQEDRMQAVGKSNPNGAEAHNCADTFRIRELEKQIKDLRVDSMRKAKALQRLQEKLDEKDLANKLLRGELEGARATSQSKDDQIHGLLNERENDARLIASLQRQLEEARVDRDELDTAVVTGQIQLVRPFRAGVLFDENGNKVLLVDGPNVAIEYTTKQVGVILKALDNIEWSVA